MEMSQIRKRMLCGRWDFNRALQMVVKYVKSDAWWWGEQYKQQLREGKKPLCLSGGKIVYVKEK